MKLLGKGPWRPSLLGGCERDVTYRATLWNSEQGRYCERDCADILYRKGDGRLQFLNTAKNVSYYGNLLKAAL